LTLIIIGFLILSGINVFALQDRNSSNENNHENIYESDDSNQINPLVSLKEYEVLNHNQNKYFKSGRNIHRKYSVMDTIIRDNFINESSELIVKTITDSPDYFSWTDYDGEDWTTPARDQGGCGSCWLFTAIGTLESIINIREGRADLDPDLSEQYVLSCIPNAGSCRGGTAEEAFYYMMDTSDDGNNCNGVILESCFPYQADDSIPCSEKSDDWMEYLVPIKNYRHIDLGYDNYRMREILKSWIIENGPVGTNMYATDFFIIWGSIFRLPFFYFPYINTIDNVYNHCVVIVGWKDNPLIKRGGYWICKNSWGTDWGYNGFFNIEYGSLNLASEIMWVDYDPGSYNWS